MEQRPFRQRYIGSYKWLAKWERTLVTVGSLNLKQDKGAVCFFSFFPLFLLSFFPQAGCGCFCRGWKSSKSSDDIYEISQRIPNLERVAGLHLVLRWLTDWLKGVERCSGIDLMVCIHYLVLENSYPSFVGSPLPYLYLIRSLGNFLFFSPADRCTVLQSIT